MNQAPINAQQQITNQIDAGAASQF